MNSFINSGLCQEHTPCPLGADRSRFQRLVADIKSRTDDYAAQLSTLTIAGYTAPPSSGEGSEREIINSLFIPDDLATKAKDDGQQEHLWRARLILAVSDQLDQDEEEIAFHMQALENDEQDLFHELQGDDDENEDDEELFAILSNLRSKMTQPNPSQVKNRLNAWKALFAKASTLPDDFILLTDRYSGDLLLEDYEKISSSPAQQLAALSLPSILGPNDSAALAAVTTFREDNRGICSELQQLLLTYQDKTPAAIDAQTTALETFLKITSKLAGEIDQSFPAEKYGRRTMSLYLCPQLSARSLLSAGPGRKTDHLSSSILLIAE